MLAGRSARRARAASRHVRGGVDMAAPPLPSNRDRAPGAYCGPAAPGSSGCTNTGPGAASARLYPRYTAGSAAGPTQLCLAANPAEKPL